MNIEIETNEFVDIEGLTEAAVMSSDENLKVIINYIRIASSYFPDVDCDDDAPSPPIMQIHEACLGELCRRRGDDYMLSDDTESTQPALRVAA